MVVTCKGCSVEGTGRQGTVGANTPPGWHALLIRGGRIEFLCSECSGKVGVHALALLEIVKDKNAHFPSMVMIGEALCG